MGSVNEMRGNSAPLFRKKSKRRRDGRIVVYYDEGRNAFPRREEECAMGKPMTSARHEEKMEIKTSRTSLEAAKSIRQASIELMRKNAKLYKELENR